MKDNLIKIWFKNFPAFGFLSYASLIICICSGIIFAIPYDVHSPFDTISLIIIRNQPALFFRSVHYWSAQLTFLLTLIHIADHIIKKSEMNISTGIWIRLSMAIAILFYLMFSGFLLKSDTESLQALNIITSLIKEIPVIGTTISYILIGNGKNLNIIYLHHIASATIIFWLISIEHSRVIFPNLKSYYYPLSLVILLSVFLIPGQTVNNPMILKGPWYFVGMQELLHWTSVPNYILNLLVFIFLMFILLKFTPKANSNSILPKCWKENKLYCFPSHVERIVLWSCFGFIKYFLLACFVIYTFLTIFGTFFRGENWKLTVPWNEPVLSNNFIGVQNLLPIDDSLLNCNISLVMGKREACMTCHKDMTGLSKSHDPANIGCFSCHLGNPLTLNKYLAHRNMSLTPGNLQNASKTCGTENCHKNILYRVNLSLMKTMSGVVSVDKFVFNESTNLNEYYDISNINFSPSERHLRGLCASCHLGQPKENPDTISELSRGGGCSACHLQYDEKSKESLVFRIQDTGFREQSLLLRNDNLLNKIKEYLFSKLNPKPQSRNPKYHPQLSLNISNNSCFGCHSRSGRISTNYNGWMETQFSEIEFSNLQKGKFRLLRDGRVFEKVQEDIHYKYGMDCIDCHISSELMGDGKKYSHKEESVKISCEDCHRTSPSKTIKYYRMNDESQKIINLRNYYDKDRQYLIAMKSGLPFTNIFLQNNQLVWEKKNGIIGNGKQESLISPPSPNLQPIYTILPPSKKCGSDISGHKRLDCKTCHSAWAPKCVGCHTQFEPKITGWDNIQRNDVAGAFLESGRDFYAEYPTLGVIINKEKDSIFKEVISTFIPGMVLTIMDGEFGNGYWKNENRKQESYIGIKNNIFKRLFAPSFSHTIVKESRDCKSCHNNPVSLGYGRGQLLFKITGKTGKWTFNPKYEFNKHDNLPEDAWIGFLSNPKQPFSTRINTRPFTIDEQKKILTVGTCLICHTKNYKKVFLPLSDAPNIKRKISKKCILPTW